MTLEEYIDSLIAQGLDQEEVSRLAEEFKPGETEGSVKTEDGAVGASAPSMGPVEAPEPTVLTLEDTFSELPEEIEVEPQAEVDVEKPKRYNSYKERMDAVGKAKYKEEYDRISNLQANITEEQITEKQANDYFNLSARPYETVIDADAPMSIRGGGFGGASEMPRTRKEYQSIEDYLGPDKYEQYQQYQETGELISDGTSENQAVIQQGRSQARYDLSKQIAELELRNVPENVQRFFGDAPVNTVDEAEDYLEFQKNNIETMAVQNKEQYASYQAEAKEVETRFNDVQRGIDEIGKVDSEEKRVLYNELVTQGNAINAEYAAGKFEERYNSIVKQQQLINSEFETFKKKTTELSDRKVLEKAASLDYSFSAKAGMAMEEFFVKDLYNNFGTLLKEVGMRGIEQAAGIQGAGYAPMFDDAVETMRQSNQNYNLQIAKKREDNIPESLKLDDIGNNNVGFFDWFTEAFADNSPSIATTFIPGGAALKTGMAVKSAAKIGTFAAKKAALQSQRAWGTAAMYTARGAFFGGGTGGKFGDIELTEANAKLQLVKLRSMMEGTEDLSKKKKLQDEIDELERVSSFSLTQKAFTSFGFGTTEMLAESLGSLKLVTGASRVAKSMGKREFKKEIYSRPINFAGNLTGRVVSGLSPLVKGGTIEVLEETVTQVAHNGIDIIVLGENKSLIEGLDKDFVANVLVTSGGIMAPKTTGNVVNILKNEFRIKSEVKANQELVVELVNLSSATSNMSKAEQVAARARKSEIIEKLALNDAISLHKLRYMTPEQIDKAADLSRQAREIGKELFKLGSSGEGSTTPEGQRAKARLQDQLDNIIDQKEALLSAKDRVLRKQMSDFFEASDGPMQNKNGEFEYYSGLFEFYQDTAMSLMPKNGKYISVKDINNLESDLAGFSKEAIATVKAGFESGSRASIIDDSIIINEEAVKKGLSLANNFVDGKYAAIAPLEELFHIYNIKNGVTKGGKLDKMSIAAVDEAIEVLKEKKELGQISDKEYNNLIARFELYKEGGRGKVVLKSGERGGAKVDSEEVLAQINNAIALGVFNREDISNIPSLRGFINGISNSIFGDSSWMFNLKTAEDVFKFAENFQKSIKDGVAIDSSSEEEEITKFSLSANDSAKVNELYETQGDAALMDVVDLMTPTAKGLTENFRNRPKYSEFKDQLQDEILTGRRGIMETIMGYPAYVKKQEAEGKAVAPLSGYLNNSFSTKTGFKRYIEIADRVLGKDEQSQFTQEINEEATSVVDESSSEQEETVKPTKERESLRKKIELTPEVTQKVRDAVAKTFGTKLPDINSPKFKMALQKAFRTELKTTMAKDVMGSRAAFETFLRDNFETIFEVIPQGVMNKRFKAFIEPVLDSSGKQKREKTAVGKPIFKKKSIVKAEFIKYFLGSEVGGSTKGTRKDALAEALAEEFAFDATMETIQTEDVATKREFLDKGQTTEKVSKKIGRPSTMKFNKAVAFDNLFQKLPFEKTKDDFNTLNGFRWGSILQATLAGSGVSAINMKTTEGRQRFKDYAVSSGLISILPKSFWISMQGSTENLLKDTTKKFGEDVKETRELVESLREDPNIVTDKEFDKQFRDYTGNLPFKSVEEVNEWISETEANGGTFAKESQVFSDMLKKENPRAKKLPMEKALNDPAFVKRQENSINGLKKVFEIFQDTMKDPEGVAFVAALMSSSGASQNHFIRKSAPWKFYQKSYLKESIREEHTLPASLIGKYLFISALGGTVSSDFVNVKKNFFQGALSKVNDDKLKGEKLNGEKFDYVEQTPEGWKITDNIWARYFNVNVGLNAGGINPSDLILADNKSVYDIHNVTSTGVKVDAKAKFSRSVANDLDGSLVPNSIKYSKPVTTQTLINALAKTDKALELARKLDQPVRKIRVFDFDDTLARTKSNVLYTMPNLEGGFSEGSTKLKAIFMVGGPGAGKTNVGKGLQLGRRGYKVVNQDIALEAMKAESGLPAKESDYTADQRSTRSKLGAAARKAAVAKFDKYAANGDGMVIDGTGASYKATTKKIEALQEKGYEVHMVVANTPLETALERNRARVERSLPDFVVQKTYDQVQESLAKYKEDFGDRLYEINTEAIQYGKPLPGDFLQGVYKGINANKVGKIDAATFAKEAGNMEAEGAQWDFSEFSKVMQGSKGPLLDVAKIIADKRGTKDVFVLTARPADAAGPIKEFLASMGLDIPLANITGLGDGTPQAKAGWIMGKAAEGYNDFYFADDHTGNVKAVKDVLSQIDVKSKVQLAKFSKSATFDTIVNDMIEDSSGIEAYKNYSAAKAKTVGASKGKYNFLIPPSAEDFTGLLYKMLGKGKKGDAQMAFLKANLLDPYNRAESAVTQAKIAAANDFKALKNQLKTLPKTLSKQTGIGKFTYSQAVRVAAWTRQGMEVPGLSKRDVKELNEFVSNDDKLNMFTNELIVIQKGKQYPKPTKDWLGGNITTDIIGDINKVNRAEYQQEWRENIDIIFSKENMNKMEAAYGTRWREAMEDSIRRMKSGSNKPIGGNRVTEGLLTWLNNSVGAVMFLNTRSALLQTISAVNFINLSDNNIVKAGVAFANQKQFWGDFMTLMNSDYLVERRNGLKINVSESEIADAVRESKNKPKAAIAFLLSKGFVMTRFADSFAIASGGSTFYRNRLKSLLKSGMDQKAAEAQAFADFKAIAEESQQSSSPSKISQQQASAAGRVILAWANTPMQYARIQKRAAQDLINGRGDWKTNVSKIVYYGAVQNLIFNTLQQAVFALGFGDDDEDDEKKAEKKNKKALSVANGMIDSQLRGLGIFGAASAAMKNALITLYEQHGKKSPKYEEAVADLLSFSPPLGSKISKIRSGFRSFSWNRKEIETKGFSLDNPAYLAGAQIVTGFTNIPLDRVVKKINNIRGIYSEKSALWQKVALGLGWSTWDVDLGYYGGFDEEVEKKKVSEMTREEKREYRKQKEVERAKIRKQREFERERRRVERNK